MSTKIVSLVIPNGEAVARVREPVTVGVPLKKGQVFDESALILLGHKEERIPLQAKRISDWSDGSIKWILLDFQVSIAANSTYQVELELDSKLAGPKKSDEGIQIQESSEGLRVETGCASFVLNTKTFQPFNQVVVGRSVILGKPGSEVQLTGSTGEIHKPLIDSVQVETQGFMRSTVLLKGHIDLLQGPTPLEFDGRVSFYRQQSFVELSFTLRNPNPAAHPGGLWDLGDAGSIYFQDLSLHVPVEKTKDAPSGWKISNGQSWQEEPRAQLEIYQDSSGGKNWKSVNHVNREGKVMHAFSGFKVSRSGSCILEGDRATPSMYLQGDQGYVLGSIDKFWQNFPKALELDGEHLIVRLFPKQYNDLFELQGGEQKTHTVYLEFGGGEFPKSLEKSEKGFSERLVPRAAQNWYAETNVFPFFAPPPQREGGSDFSRAMNQADEIVAGIISGTDSFFNRREIIDEFGWRHFGDLYADHEAVHSTKDQPLIAHYNNQYDVVYGGIIQFLRTGNDAWFELSQDLARHVIDIDIYHTTKDRSVYSGGLFWHTDHYFDAATGTHRAFSKANLGGRGVHEYGGGPSNEHNFACGLLHYYLLTGDHSAAEMVKTLGDWVLAMDDGSDNKFGWIDRRPTGQCSATASRYYHGPGRGSAFSISTLLDAFELTRDPKYLAKVDELVQRCIHPKDDIEARGLENIEAKWSYLVFLQVLGKYLFVKEEREECDYLFHYARASLLHYANWMVDHEVPYKQLLHKVCLPTETWPAQDIRKSFVFGIAAQFATGEERELFNLKRKYFLEACIRDLLTFKTCILTRPLVLLLTNVYAQDYFQKLAEHEPRVREIPAFKFGTPKTFTPQLFELLKLRELVYKGIGVLKSFKKPSQHREK